MSKYFIGIDGGGSKTAFAVIDEQKNIIKELRLERGSNPWHYGLDAVLSVLKEGFAELETYQKETIGLVAGLSGMLTHNQFTVPIKDYLQTFCPQACITGDLPTAFRAVTDQQSGIMAIAGTGSSVIHLFGDGSTYVYDGVGAGGRDLGFLLASAYRRGTLHVPASRAFMAQIAPILQTDDLRTTADYYHNEQLRDVARHIAQLDPADPVFSGLQPWTDAVVDRWRFKLYGITQKFMQKEPEVPVTLVLGGGLWSWDYLRSQVIDALTEDFPEIQIVYEPASHPVLGAAYLARDMFGAKR